MELLTIGIIAGAFVILWLMMYRIVPPQEAHFVTAPWGTKVCAADDNVGKSRWYLRIPFLITVRKLPITIRELVVEQETYEKNQARYNVKSSLKYRIIDPTTSANTFTNENELNEQLQDVVRSSVRAVTVKFDVTEARSNKTLMSDEITKEILDDLGQWGLRLVSFQLIDFQDTEDSDIISDISKRREVEIQTTTREQNAEKIKQAKVKEAEADEQSQSREILRDKVVGERKQEKLEAIAIKETAARKQEYEIKKVEIVKQAEINKAQAIVKANQDKETEFIKKEQKKLEGEGDRLRDEERAKGEAAPIREKGFAEAEAKEKLQEALNKFGDSAIRALVAEQIVAAEKEVGIAGASALKEADVKVFAGDGGKDAFDVGKMISAVGVGNSSMAESLLHRIKKPNDLGIGDTFGENKENKTNTETKETKKPGRMGDTLTR